jgi:F0F1-type ATP synthase membrane subunit b/b'
MQDGGARQTPHAGFSRRLGCCVGATVVAALLPAVHGALAAAGHGEGQAPAVSDLALPFVNFLLFLWLLRRAGGGLLRDHLRRRRAEVISSLEAATRARAEAEQLHREMRARLAGVAGDAERLRSDMRAMAGIERTRRRELAEAAVARITSDARFIAEQEVRVARAALREEMVVAAVAEAVALLQRQIAPADHDRFLREFVGALRAVR